MSRFFTLLALPIVAGTCLAIAGCAEAPQQTRSEQAQYDACRRHADLVTTQQNRDVLSMDAPISSPYGGDSILTHNTDSLMIQHQQQDLVADCLNHLDSQPPNAGNVTAHPEAAAPAAPPPPPPADLATPNGSDLARPPSLPTS